MHALLHTDNMLCTHPHATQRTTQANGQVLEVWVRRDVQECSQTSTTQALAEEHPRNTAS